MIVPAACASPPPRPRARARARVDARAPRSRLGPRVRLASASRCGQAAALASPSEIGARRAGPIRLMLPARVNDRAVASLPRRSTSAVDAASCGCCSAAEFFGGASAAGRRLRRRRTSCGKLDGALGGVHVERNTRIYEYHRCAWCRVARGAARRVGDHAANSARVFVEPDDSRWAPLTPLASLSLARSRSATNAAHRPRPWSRPPTRPEFAPTWRDRDRPRPVRAAPRSCAKATARFTGLDGDRRARARGASAPDVVARAAVAHPTSFSSTAVDRAAEHLPRRELLNAAALRRFFAPAYFARRELPIARRAARTRAAPASRCLLEQPARAARRGGACASPIVRLRSVRVGTPACRRMREHRHDTFVQAAAARSAAAGEGRSRR